MSVLENEYVRSELKRSWDESQPASSTAHEEGGFVLRDADGRLTVERWPRGVQSEISVPPHPAGRRGELTIIATFHTHPNPGADFQQEPSVSDIRAVRADGELKHAEFESEYVIASEHIYRIRNSGDVEIVGSTRTLLRIN